MCPLTYSQKYLDHVPKRVFTVCSLTEIESSCSVSAAGSKTVSKSWFAQFHLQTVKYETIKRRGVGMRNHRK